jgi:hypothetical protein
MTSSGRDAAILTYTGSALASTGSVVAIAT